MSNPPTPHVWRITFDVGDEIHKSLCTIPHGFRRYAYRWLMEGYALYLRQNPEQALHELMSRRLNYSQLLNQGALSGGSVERSDEPGSAKSARTA